MKQQTWLAAILVVFGLGMAVRADECVSKRCASVTPGCACDQCQTCEGQGSGVSSFWSRHMRKWNRHWRRHWQRDKGLEHPECPPFCDPNFGYHQTCWRKFPPIIRPCPPQLPCEPLHLPPAAETSIPKVPATKAVAVSQESEESDLPEKPLFRLTLPSENFKSSDEKAWKVTRTSATSR